MVEGNKQPRSVVGDLFRARLAEAGNNCRREPALPPLEEPVGQPPVAFDQIKCAFFSSFTETPRHAKDVALQSGRNSAEVASGLKTSGGGWGGAANVRRAKSALSKSLVEMQVLRPFLKTRKSGVS